MMMAENHVGVENAGTQVGSGMMMRTVAVVKNNDDEGTAKKLF